ncbi:MAG: roadblock/LC7 domain-containing protein [Aquificaceae bacterium]|nr:roadblock/LC7 domain-containing protein [Aquificaceae bacterium]
MELDLVEYELDEQIKKQVEATMQNLLKKTSASVVILTDDAGRIIDIRGNVKNHVETEFIATLVSGLFSAAVEMSKLLNIGQLDFLNYESKDTEVVIKHIPPRFLLGVIATKKTSLGGLRLFLKEASLILSKVLENAQMLPAKTVKIDVAELERRLNQILSE